MNDRGATLKCGVPVLGIVAWSGTGKTTLLEALLPRLAKRGWPTAVVKHAHHDFDIDKPGKDSHRLREAGAAPMIVASRRRFAIMMETPDQEEPDLVALLAQAAALKPALILVEGFKQWPLPKLELRREKHAGPLMAATDPWIEAVALKSHVTSVAANSEAEDRPEAEKLPPDVARLDLDDLDALLEWIIAWARQQAL